MIEDMIEFKPLITITARGSLPPMSSYYEENLLELSDQCLKDVLTELESAVEYIKNNVREIRTCPYCNQHFVPRRKDQKFCKSTCRTSYNRRLYERKHPEKQKERYWRKKNALQSIRKL